MTDADHDSIVTNISRAIQKMKNEDTTGCSVGNLKQMTSTRGYMGTKPEYDLVFESIAAKAATNFDLWIE